MSDRRHPFDRKYDPVEAAYAVRQYLDLDPAFFIEVATRLDMNPATDGKLILLNGFDDGPSQFLWHWMKISGEGKAIRQELLDRGLRQIEGEEAAPVARPSRRRRSRR